MNVWISTRQAMRSFDEPIEIERAVYRSHRMVGALLLLGALFTLYVIGLRFKGPELGFVMTKFVRAEVASWIGHSLRAFLIVVNLAALAIAATMLIRPSALKRVEAWANASYSGRQATKIWEIPRVSVDRLVERHPRLMGTALTLASVYLVLALVYERFIVGH